LTLIKWNLSENHFPLIDHVTNNTFRGGGRAIGGVNR
jgi:hypothetical protein